MSSRVYIDVLKGNFRALGYFADELFSVESDKEFFRHIAQYVVSLIRKSPYFETFYFRWIKEKDRYLKEHARLQANIPMEVEQSFTSLNLELKGSSFLEDQDVRHYIDAIATILETKRPSGIPSYVYAAEEKLQQLLLRLLRLGADKVVSNYGIIIEVNASGINHATGEWEYFDKDISSFSFAPSIIQLREMDIVFSRKHNATDASWVAWEFLSLVEWCWNTPSSFFDDKNLSFKDYESGNTSQYLLVLHNDWAEVNILKAGDVEYAPQVSFFARDRFAAYIKLVLNEIILEQEQEYIDLDNIAQGHDEVISPYSVKFRLQYNELFMDVCWFEDIDCTVYLVQTFQDGFKPMQYITDLMSASVGDTIVISKDKNPGGSVAKYLEAANLNNFLGALLFERVNSYAISVKRKFVMGDDISQSDRNVLKHLIKSNYKEMPSCL